MKRGYWRLTWESITDGEDEITNLNDSDRQQISQLVEQGCTEGEFVQEEDDFEGF